MCKKRNKERKQLKYVIEREGEEEGATKSAAVYDGSRLLLVTLCDCNNR